MNGNCLEENEYFLAGQIMAMSLVHNGIGPRYLSTTLYECLTKGPGKVTVSIEEVHDSEVRYSLQDLRDAKTVEEARVIIASTNLETLLYLSGNIPVVRNLNDVERIVRGAIGWYVLGRTRPALESFKEGLASFDIFISMIANSELFKPEMCFTNQKLTSEVINDTFSVNRSEKGSNRYERESVLLGYWRDLLVDIDEGNAEITHSDILYFSTGCRVIPSTFFIAGIEFLHDVEESGQHSQFPKANTCSCILHLPTVQDIQRL